MFIGNISGKESISVLAASIGCKAGESLETLRPGLIGNTFDIKDQLKTAGARWDGFNKAWTFNGWADLEAALKTIIGA